STVERDVQTGECPSCRLSGLSRGGQCRVVWSNRLTRRRDYLAGHRGWCRRRRGHDTVFLCQVARIDLRDIGGARKRGGHAPELKRGTLAANDLNVPVIRD